MFVRQCSHRINITEYYRPRGKTIALTWCLFRRGTLKKVQCNSTAEACNHLKSAGEGKNFEQKPGNETMDNKEKHKLEND